VLNGDDVITSKIVYEVATAEGVKRVALVVHTSFASNEPKPERIRPFGNPDAGSPRS
jgi:hypothetical protein